VPLERIGSCEPWPGSRSGVSVQAAIRRLNEGICFPQFVVSEHAGHGDRGNPVLAAMTGVAFEDDQVRAWLLFADSAREIREAWPNLDIRASSRELGGPAAGKHRGRIWIALADGWWAIRLITGDDERMARGVLRHVMDCVGRSRAMLESRLAELDPRYRIEPLPQPEQAFDQDGSESPFYELSPASRLEALLTLRVHIIEATRLDDLDDEQTTVLEGLRELAEAASGDARERLRHACVFELAVGRYLGAEALHGHESKTRAVRQARMREAFDAACKAFSQFAELGPDAARGRDGLEVRPCSIEG
jgi:hypothetical protein